MFLYNLMEGTGFLTPIERWQLALECVDYNYTCMAFTWSPSPSRFTSKKKRKQWMQMIGAGLSGFLECTSIFCMIPEIADSGRLHCHGFFQLSDKIKWFKSVLPRMEYWGWTKIKVIDSVGWYEYCSEEIEMTQGVIGQDLVPFDYYAMERYRRINEVKKLKLSSVMKKYKAQPRPNLLKYFVLEDLKDDEDI